MKNPESYWSPWDRMQAEEVFDTAWSTAPEHARSILATYLRLAHPEASQEARQWLCRRIAMDFAAAEDSMATPSEPEAPIRRSS